MPSSPFYIQCVGNIVAVLPTKKLSGEQFERFARSAQKAQAFFEGPRLANQRSCIMEMQPFLRLIVYFVVTGIVAFSEQSLL
jgi:hypothetical protein